MTMAGLKPIERRLASLPTLAIALVLALTLLPAILHMHQQINRAHYAQPLQTVTNDDTLSRLTPESSKLLFMTLSFKFPSERPMLDHNCATLSRAGYHYHIHTDDIAQPYCKLCNCILFVPSNCTCPQPHRYDCPLCEKLHFLKDRIGERKEFVFLDSDLIILRDEFMPALQQRALYFDFLAAYGFGNYSRWRYSAPFNSGLIFVRRLPGIDYEKMISLMYEMGTNNDQNVISAFVHKYYKRWDTLSLNWHCRYLYRREHDIPFDECFTFHGRRQALKAALHGRKFQLRRTKQWLGIMGIFLYFRCFPFHSPPFNF